MLCNMRSEIKVLSSLRNQHLEFQLLAREPLVKNITRKPNISNIIHIKLLKILRFCYKKKTVSPFLKKGVLFENDAGLPF